MKPIHFKEVHIAYLNKNYRTILSGFEKLAENKAFNDYIQFL